MQRPRDLADRSRDLRDLSKLTDDGPLHETFTLPPGRVELAMRRQPTLTRYYGANATGARS
jgi:hypothetical protein